MTEHPFTSHRESLHALAASMFQLSMSIIDPSVRVLAARAGLEALDKLDALDVDEHLEEEVAKSQSELLDDIRAHLDTLEVDVDAAELLQRTLDLFDDDFDLVELGEE